MRKWERELKQSKSQGQVANTGLELKSGEYCAELQHLLQGKATRDRARGYDVINLDSGPQINTCHWLSKLFTYQFGAFSILGAVFASSL